MNKNALFLSLIAIINCSFAGVRQSKPSVPRGQREPDSVQTASMSDEEKYSYAQKLEAEGTAVPLARAWLIYSDLYEKDKQTVYKEAMYRARRTLDALMPGSHFVAC